MKIQHIIITSLVFVVIGLAQWQTGIVIMGQGLIATGTVLFVLAPLMSDE